MKSVVRFGVSLTLIFLLCLSLPGSVFAAKEKINVWGWGEAAMAIEAIAKQFEEQSGIEINLVKMGPWDVMDKFLISLRAGKGAPDVCEIVRRVFDPYVATGKLVDMTDAIRPYQDDLIDTALKASTFNNRIWGAPGDINPGWVVYNRELFAKHGIDPKKIVTWDDMIAAGRRLNQHNVKLLHLSIPSINLGMNHFVLYLNSRGGNIYDANGKVIRNNALARDTLKWFYGLKELAFLAPHGDPSIFAALKEGKFAVYAHNAGMSSVMKKQAPELAGKMAVMPWPKWSVDAKPTTGQWGGAVWVIPKQSVKKEAATKFIKFLNASDTGALAYWTQGSLLPAYKPAYKAKEFRQPDPYFGGQVTYESLEVREIPPLYQFDWSETEMVLQNAIDAMFQGAISPEAAWAQIEKELIATLDR